MAQISETKDTNPKREAGAAKVPLHLNPPTALIHMALAFYDGNRKYGAWNWRIAGASASTYVAAAKRHIDLWVEGEEFDPLTGVHHLGYAMACMAIILDARNCAKLEDDRPPASNYAELQAASHKLTQYVTDIHKDKSPYHYTWKDNGQQDHSDPSKSQQSDNSAQLRTQVPIGEAASRC